MSSITKLGLRHFAFIAVWLALCWSAAASEILVQSTKFSLPPPKSALQTHKFFVSPKSAGTINLWKELAVEDIQGPGGWNPSNEAITAISDEKTAEQVTVVLTFRRSEFVMPGTYKISVRLKGKRTATAKSADKPGKTTLIDEVIELSLVKPTATLTVQHDESYQYVLRRNWPWSSATLSTTMTAMIDNNLNIGDVKVTSGPVRRVIRKDGTNSNSTDTNGKIEPSTFKLENGGGSTNINFSTFDQAGDFRSSLTFSGSDLKTVKPVKILVRVKDAWYFPFFIILVGVACGASMHWLVRNWRPQQVLKYRLAELRSRVERMEHAVYTQVNLRKLSDIRRNIAEMEGLIGAGLVGEARIKDVTKNVEDFESALAITHGKAASSLNQLKRDLADTRRALKRILDAGKFSTIDTGVDEIWQLLTNNRSEEAEAQVSETLRRFEAEREDIVQRIIGGLHQKLEVIVDSIKQAKLREQLETVKSKPVPPDTIYTIGDALSRLFEDISTDGSTEAIPARASSPAVHATEDLRILASPAPRANVQTLFTIENLPDQAAAESVTWTIRGSRVRGDADTFSAAQIFYTPGTVMVQAEIAIKDSSHILVETASFNVLPSASQSKMWRLVSSIESADMIVMAVALIVATAGGFIANYSGKPFGTVEDYFIAWLWGFGLEKTVRGFSATFTALSTAK